MHADHVVLRIGGKELDSFLGYRITSDIYSPASPFSIEFGTRPDIRSGDRCEIHVNGRRELNGIIDDVDQSIDHGSSSYRVSGTPLVGLLEKHYLTKFSALPKDIVACAKKLIADVPYVSGLDVQMTSPAKETNTEDHKPSPGDTVFSVLSAYATARGLVFSARADGALLFLSPKDGGAAKYQLEGLDVENGGFAQRIAGLASKIIVISDNEDGGTGTRVTVENPTAPYYKPFVASFNGNSTALKRQAETLLHQQRLAAFQASYTVPGHSRHGDNWRVNELVHVDDPIRHIRGTLLLHQRTFERNRRGTFTRLTLGMTPSMTKFPGAK